MVVVSLPNFTLGVPYYYSRQILTQRTTLIHHEQRAHSNLILELNIKQSSAKMVRNTPCCHLHLKDQSTSIVTNNNHKPFSMELNSSTLHLPTDTNTISMETTPNCSLFKHWNSTLLEGSYYSNVALEFPNFYTHHGTRNPYVERQERL